jgi:hypothetical protein
MGEFKACRATLTSVNPSALGRGVLLGVSQSEIQAALSALEGTYFLRFAAEAERAMRIHLSTHFPRVELSKRDGFGRLLSKCAFNFDPAQPGAKMPSHLVSEAMTLTDYRNDQAHSLRLGFTFPDIYSAQTKLSRFLYCLPA